MSEGALDMQADFAAAHALADRAGPGAGGTRARVEAIQRLACAHYGVTRDALLGDRRTPLLVTARHVAMFVAAQTTPLSLAALGRRFGDRDRATVRHALRRIAARRAADRTLAAEVAALSDAARLRLGAPS